MKLLIKKIANLKLIIYLRNLFNIRPKKSRAIDYLNPVTISDSFIWRTDSGFSTKFKFTDILNLFYKIENSWVEIHIYSKNNILLKIEKIENLDFSNEFEITAEYLDNLEDYGVFYIYHFTKNPLQRNNAVSNRCYLGFSKNGSLHSFVHGNSLAKYTTIKPSKLISNLTDKTSIFKDVNYKIQKYFYGFEKNELFFANYTSQNIKFTLENQDYKLKSGCSIIIKTFNPTLHIISNCYLRPTIFSYNKEFFDVHHA
jgi:hypothetical protein